MKRNRVQIKDIYCKSAEGSILHGKTLRMCRVLPFSTIKETLANAIKQEKIKSIKIKKEELKLLHTADNKII